MVIFSAPTSMGRSELWCTVARPCTVAGSGRGARRPRGTTSTTSAARQMTAATMRRRTFKRSGVSVVSPRMCRVAVAAQFPVSETVLRQHFDAADPLRALPGVDLWRDDPDGPTVLDSERLAFGGVHEQPVVRQLLVERRGGG